MSDLCIHSPCNAGLFGYVVVLHFGVQIGNEAAYSGSFDKMKGLKIRLGEKMLKGFLFILNAYQVACCNDGQ